MGTYSMTAGAIAVAIGLGELYSRLNQLTCSQASQITKYNIFVKFKYKIYMPPWLCT